MHICKNNACHVEGKEFAKVILGWSSSNCILYHESNTHIENSWHDTWKKFTCKKLDVSHLTMFGYITYVHVLDVKRSKLNPKAKKFIFIGYSLEQKGYKCFNPSTQKL
jgi:hypothetical protein